MGKKRTPHQKWLRRLKMKEVVMNLGMFDFYVICAIGPFASLEKYLQFKFDDEDLKFKDTGFNAKGRFSWSDGFTPVIWIPKYPVNPRDIGSLSHECLHAVMYVLHWADIKPNDDTEEVIAHMLSYLVSTILSSNPHRL